MQTRQESEQQNQSKQDQYYYSNFINSLKSKDTKTVYIKRIDCFMNFLGIKKGEYSRLVEGLDKKTIENNIKSFLVYLRQERGGISYRTASFYLNSIKKFYYVNTEFDFRWQMIKMYLGDDDDQNTEAAPIEEDRPYTRQEIHTMLKSANDTRTKIIILLIASSGMRMGAIPLLRLRNLVRNEQLGIYQISVYEGSRKSNYKTFCTPECTAVIDAYLDYRKHAGETLKDTSPLLREQFNPEDIFKVSNARPIGTGLVKYLVNQVLVKYSTLKQKLKYDYEKRRKTGRNPTMLTHALRKFFDTECRKAGVYPDFVELLMGHKLAGVRSHYFKPDIQTLLEGTAECKGYKSAINDLTINEEFRLSKKVEELKQKDDYNNYLIDRKMQEKDEQIQSLQDQVKLILDSMEKHEGMVMKYQKKWLAKDFGDNKMYMPSPEYKQQIFPLADMDEEIFYEICRDHNPMTCKEPECLEYQRKELEHKQRMEELRRNNPNRTNKKSKYIFPL